MKVRIIRMALVFMDEYAERNVKYYPVFIHFKSDTMAVPTLGNGKICYLKIPTDDARISADFYHKVFGWEVRKRNDGSLAFDDGVGQVSGTWAMGEKASVQQGILVYIMVDNAETTMLRIITHGGSIMQEVGAEAPEVTAMFRDPFGNIWGIYEHPR